ncbi:MAG: 3-oxoacyl-ACP reductase FabG [Gammaproteobacteria bacterium]|nr:MAG: 3-oxoacyl-ACP reductase FabG [Gammaproteobacteria bacterium]
MTLENEIALVTGATRGIGQAIAKALGDAGATVIGTATSENGANAIDTVFKNADINGKGVVLDVNDADAVNALITEIGSEFGAPTILVNNAGITRDNLLMRMKDEEWDSVISTNLTSIYRLSKAVLRGMMKAKKGRIISIASVVGVMGNAGQANYASAKAGIIGFSKSLAREVGSRGITVNTIAPGFIETDMTRSLGDEQREALINQVPLSRLGSVDDIAQTALFLASPGAAYITGETIHVNGGMYMI